MKYKYITDPLNNNQVKIDSVKGKKILKNYLKHLIGGGTNVDLLNCRNKKGLKLGQGGFKRIYKTDCSESSWTNENVIFTEEFTKKKCDNSIFAEVAVDRNDFMREINMQELAGSPEIYRYGVCKDSGRYYKIEEKLDMDLFDLLKNNVIWEQIENFKKKFLSLLRNLKRLHAKGYGHFDIKPENIMVKFNKNSRKIKQFSMIDYGFTNKIPSRIMKGTFGYFDSSRSVMDDKTDIFALGITLLNVFFKNSLIYDESVRWRRGINIGLTPRSSETPIDWIVRTYSNTHFQSDIKKFRKYPLFTHLIYSMLIIDNDKRGRYTCNKRYDINKVISHSFWKVKMEDEKKLWEDTPEYQDVLNIEELKMQMEREKREKHRIRLENNRKYNREKFGTSKRGDNCVCIGPCEHQGILDCIAGICKNTKKCPVDPDECNGKNLDKC